MSKISRRALCAGFLAAPVLGAIGVGPIIVLPIQTVSAPPIPDLIGRVIAVVAEHHDVSADAIVGRLATPENMSAHLTALLLAMNLSTKGSAEIGRRFGIENRWFVGGRLKKASAKASRDPACVDLILDLAGRVHPDAPAMLLGDIPFRDLEQAPVRL